MLGQAENVAAGGQIHAGAECLAGTGHDNGADLGVVIHAREKVDQFLGHFDGEGIHLIRPVQRERGDPVGLGDAKRLVVVHGVSSTCCCLGRPGWYSAISVAVCLVPLEVHPQGDRCGALGSGLSDIGVLEHGGVEDQVADAFIGEIAAA